MISRLFGSLLVLSCSVSLGARTKRAGGPKKDVKYVSGVPILNHGLANSKKAAGGGAVKDWVAVGKQGVTDAEVTKMCESVDKVKCLRKGHPDAGGIRFFVVRCTEGKLKKIVKKSGNKIAFFEPDSVKRLDPEETKSQRTGQTVGSWGLERVGAPTRERTGKGAHVYVVDTGIRFSHIDFGMRATSAIDMTSDSLVECGGDTGCAFDRQGHGTHCAGTAAGTNYGVASEAKLYAVKTLSDEDGSGPWSWDYEALDWMARHANRPAVVSASLGGPGTQAAYAAAVDRAVEAGLVVVVAGGNENSNACGFTPAYIPAAITVGSTDSNDRKSGFSNYGPCTDIWAPGSSITSASWQSDEGTETYSGTSMACPHVSGAVALLMEENISSNEIVETLLERSAENVITGLRPDDSNYLLWVGKGDAEDGTAEPTNPNDPCLQCTRSWQCWYLDRCSSCSCS